MSTPAQLSTETIINLAENGVPAETFAAMMRESFKNRVDKLTQWDGPDGLYKLWKNVCDEGHVVAVEVSNLAASPVLDHLNGEREAHSNRGTRELVSLLLRLPA